MRWWAVLALVACSESQLVSEEPPDAVGPLIEVDPRVLDFGNPPAGSETVRSFTIHSVGDATLTVGDIDIEDQYGFSLGNFVYGDIGAGAVMTVDVHYMSDGVPKTSQARIYSDDSSNPIVPVDLLVADSAGVLTIEPDPIDFGATGLNLLVERTATLRNDGSGPLTVSSVRLDGDFAILEKPDLPLTLDVGETAEVLLGFAPQRDGEHVGLFWADSDAAISNSPVDVAGETELTVVTGRICNPAGSGYVAGARVWAEVDYNGDGTIDATPETVTDGDGWFVLEDLPPGPVVIHVEKGSFGTTLNVTVPAGGSYELPEDECLDQGDLKIAVLPGTYDDIGSLLTAIGLTYTVETGALLMNKSDMDDYDLIFVACAAVSSSMSVDADEVRDYIYDGGSLYSSDLTLNAFVDVFPDEYVPMGGGYWAPTTATLVDPNLIAITGSTTITINYESGVDPDLIDSDPDVTSEILMTAAPTGPTLPITVRMTYGAGTGVFTSFHTSATASPDINALFEEIVLSM